MYDVLTLDQVLGSALDYERFTVLLICVFSAVALALAAVGIYGVMSYAVSQRTREIGLRMALGARRNDVMLMVFAQGIKLTGAGVLIGFGGALALTRLMKTLVFDVSASDPLTLIAVALLLTIVAVLASLIPALRAIKVDPMIALRCD